jgi:hypothetical protein
MVEKSAGEHADWKTVDSSMIQASSIARPGARQGHTPQPVARLSAALEVVGAWPR